MHPPQSPMIIQLNCPVGVIFLVDQETCGHLMKSYCVPSVLYGCETWYLDRHDYHRLNVLWNNSFRKIFSNVLFR